MSERISKMCKAMTASKIRVHKSDLEKFDQVLAKSWGKAEGAPAPASMPAPPKPKMSQPKMPKMKAPGAKPAAPQMQMSEVKKDDKAHQAGNPEASAHEVVESGASLPKMAAQMNRKGHEASQRFFNHLRSLKDKSKLRSPENVMKAEGDSGKKYVTVSQHWASGIHDKATGKYANPVKDAGKSRPEHMDDLHALKAKGHISSWGEHDKPVKHWGSETYEKHPDGKLKFVHADYDTSD